MMLHIVPMVVNSQLEVVRIQEIAERITLETPGHKVKVTQVGGPTDFETPGKRYLDLTATSPAKIQQFQDELREFKRMANKLVKLGWNPDAKPPELPVSEVEGEPVASAMARGFKLDIEASNDVTGVEPVDSPPADDRDDGVAQDDLDGLGDHDGDLPEAA